MVKKLLILFCFCLPIFSEVVTNGDTRFIGTVDMSESPYIKLPIVNINPTGTNCSTENSLIVSTVTLSTFLCHSGIWTQQTFTATGAGLPNGLATLDSNSHLITSQIPLFGGDVQNTAGSNSLTVLKVNGVSFGSSPLTNTVPVVTTSGVTTYEAVPNSALANSSIIINTTSGITGGGTVALGGTLNLSLGTLSLSNLSDASTVARNNASNTFTSLQDISNGTLKIPISTSYAPTTVGLFGLNSSNSTVVYGDGSATRILTWITGTMPTPGNGVQWGSNGQLEDTGSPPGSGAGGGITALTNDITASGSGSVSATVNKVGGQTAAAIASASSAWASPNTANSMVKLTASAVVPTTQIPAGIDAAKIGNGDVSSTILSYLNSLTGNVQTQLDGKITPNIATKTSTYTATITDYTLLANATTAAFSITLPSSPKTGQVINIKKIDSTGNVVTINGNSKTIDGSSTISISTQNQAYTLQYDGTSWYIL